MQRRTILLILSIGLGAVIAGALLARLTTQTPLALAGGTWLPEPRTLAAFRLSDQAGRECSDADLQGRPSLLFFGFTYCPDVCPTTLATLADALRRAPLARAAGAVRHRRSRTRHRGGAQGLPRRLRPRFHRPARRRRRPWTRCCASLGAIAIRQPLAGGSYTMDHYGNALPARHARPAGGRVHAAVCSRRLAADLDRIARSGRL